MSYRFSQNNKALKKKFTNNDKKNCEIIIRLNSLSQIKNIEIKSNFEISIE